MWCRIASFGYSLPVVTVLSCLLRRVPCRQSQTCRPHLSRLSKYRRRLTVPLSWPYLGALHHTVFSNRNPVTMGKATEAAEPGAKEVDAMLTKGKLIMQKLEESLDVKVNEITPELFRLGGTPEKMRDLGEDRIRKIIKQIGLAPQKAKNIAKLSAVICEKFEGQVPDTFEELESLSGVGHKTASVVMMQAFRKPAFPVDTHIHRLACRWGCGDAKSVVKTEESLKQWFPDPNTWGDLHVRIILFGREHCPARNHDMDQCPVCSFAATDEARQANRLNPKKFTPAKTHKNPYSVRPVSVPLKQEIEFEEDDADYVEGREKKASRRKPRANGKVQVKGLAGNEGVVKPSSKTQRRRGSTGKSTVERLDVEAEQHGGVSSGKKRTRKTRQSQQNEGTSEVAGENKIRRTSSRIRQKMAQEE